MHVFVAGCVCLWFETAADGGGTVYFPVAVGEGGGPLHAIGPLGRFQCKWHHIFASDLLKSGRDVIAVSFTLSLFPLSPSSLSYTTPFTRPLFILVLSLPTFRSFFFSLFFFFPASCGGKHTGIGIKQERATEREERERAKMQTHLPLPITQFLQIKAIPMNIYVLEGSAGPDDMTKREGKLPPCGRKKASETQKRRDLVLILMFSW